MSVFDGGKHRVGSPHGHISLLTNLEIYRQDAKFAKVDLLTRKPQSPWCPWRLGGDFLEVTCLATPGRRVLVLKGIMKNSKAAYFTTDYTDFKGFHGEDGNVLSKHQVTLRVNSL